MTTLGALLVTVGPRHRYFQSGGDIILLKSKQQQASGIFHLTRADWVVQGALFATCSSWFQQMEVFRLKCLAKHGCYAHVSGLRVFNA
mmetsp:Transcript_7736/g.14254  ORF Transcript_7736/g.14254 Transcript_7736/m.14254 type:complete len:88 (-) Transcript_7736:626-889(-)